MDEKRKELIIKEIKYWKNSKLIPERYCDFLLTLYTGGIQEPVSGKKPTSYLQWIQILLPAMLFIAILVIYFTNFSNTMQIVIVITFTVAIVLLANKVKGHHLYLSYLYLFMAAMILYLVTINIIINMFDANSNYVAMATLVHCATWFAIGLKWRIHFFTVASMFGIGVLLFFIL